VRAGDTVPLSLFRAYLGSCCDLRYEEQGITTFSPTTLRVPYLLPPLLFLHTMQLRSQVGLAGRRVAVFVGTRGTFPADRTRVGLVIGLSVGLPVVALTASVIGGVIYAKRRSARRKAVPRPSVVCPEVCSQLETLHRVHLRLVCRM